jgi:hypothetical protein
MRPVIGKNAAQIRKNLSALAAGIVTAAELLRSPESEQGQAKEVTAAAAVDEPQDPREDSWPQRIVT